MLRRSQDRFRQLLPGGYSAGTLIAIAVALIVVLWLASGFYRVQPDEAGVVLRFGAYNRMTQPGLNYHLPIPIESALTPSVTRVNRTEVGYRSGEVGDAAGQSPAARRSADADRRRKYRRHQLHRVLGGQGREGLSVQHPRRRRPR